MHLIEPHLVIQLKNEYVIWRASHQKCLNLVSKNQLGNSLNTLEEGGVLHYIPREKNGKEKEIHDTIYQERGKKSPPNPHQDP